MSASTKVRVAVTQPVAAPTLRPALSRTRTPLVQRACACGAKAGTSGECEDCEKKKLTLQKSSTGTSPAAVPTSVHQTLASPGRSLDAPTRGFMESRFGQDFGGVRLHTDAQAAESARDVNARAYTVGQHIAFAPGQYAPHTESGKHLLAHELAHTIQQQGNSSGIQAMTEIAPPNTPLEREADTAARSVLAGDAVRISPVPMAGLQRQMNCQQILAADTDPQLIPADYVRFGNEVHRIITDDFRGQAGANAVNLNIPGGSSAPYKTEGCHEQAASTRIGSQITSSEGDRPDSRLGGGIPDLAYRDGRVVELAEIKAGTQTCVPLAVDQLDNYIRQGMAQDPVATQWRQRNNIDNIILMSSSRFQPTAPINAMGLFTEVACCPTSPGVIVYKAVVPQAGQTTAARTLAAGEPYDISLRGQMNTLTVNPAPQETDLLNTGPQNQVIAQSVPGAILRLLERKKAGSGKRDEIQADIVQPLLFGTGAARTAVRYVVDARTRQLTLVNKRAQIPVEYHGLSTGMIVLLNHDETTGLSGEGVINPSIPLLKNIAIKFAFARDKLEVIGDLPSKPKIPIPGVTVTSAQISLILAPEFKPSGTINFTIGPAGKKFIEGVFTISADAQGFFVQGDGAVTIPGVDDTKLNLTYRPATGWQGSVNLTTSKIPRIKRANVTLSFDDTGMILTGGMNVDLPGNANELELNVKRDRAGNWIFAGGATFTVPVKGVNPVNLDFEYDITQDRLKGSGSTGFQVRGLSGSIFIGYDNGKITGKGFLNVKKGRVEGKLDPVEMDEYGRFSGKGTLTYQLTKDLIASITVEMSKDQQVTVSGSIEFTKPIELFTGVKGDYKIFSVDITVPIPGLSIGVAGVVAIVGGSLSAGYYFGPAVVRNIKIAGSIKPLDENPDAQVTLSAEFFCPAGAYITGAIHAGIGLDAKIAGVSGNIEIGSTAQLDGFVSVPAEIAYTKERIAAQAGFVFDSQLKLILKLDAFVYAYAGFGPFKVDTEFRWNLAKYEYAPENLKLGMKLKKPIRYATDEAFKLPSLDDIEWTLPKIDTESMMNSLVGSTSPAKTEK